VPTHGGFSIRTGSSSPPSLPASIYHLPHSTHPAHFSPLVLALARSFPLDFFTFFNGTILHALFLPSLLFGPGWFPFRPPSFDLAQCVFLIDLFLYSRPNNNKTLLIISKIKNVLFFKSAHLSYPVNSRFTARPLFFSLHLFSIWFLLSPFPSPSPLPLFYLRRQSPSSFFLPCPLARVFPIIKKVALSEKKIFSFFAYTPLPPCITSIVPTLIFDRRIQPAITHITDHSISPPSWPPLSSLPPFSSSLFRTSTA